MKHLFEFVRLSLEVFGSPVLARYNDFTSFYKIQNVLKRYYCLEFVMCAILSYER